MNTTGLPQSYLIDSSIYFFRYYFSDLPFHESRSGREVSTVLSYVRWLLSFIELQRPIHAAICFDESLGTCFRNEIDPNYKANREFPDEALAYELLATKKIADLLGFPVYASARYEADDLIAALSKFSSAQRISPVVVSRDKDLGQLLLDENCCLWDAPKGEKYSRATLAIKLGFDPIFMADFLAMVGDSVDNIKGVPGLGPKTAAALLNRIGCWEKIKTNLDAVLTSGVRGAFKMRGLIEEHCDRVDQNLMLTKLNAACIPVDELDLSVKPTDLESLTLLFDEFQFPASMYKRINKLEQN